MKVGVRQDLATADQSEHTWVSSRMADADAAIGIIIGRSDSAQIGCTPRARESPSTSWLISRNESP